MRIFKLIIVAHIILLVCNSIFMTIHSYTSFYEKKLPDNIWYKGVGRLIANPYLEANGKYTGAETGYGFYAPNVASSCIMVLEDGNGRKMQPSFGNYETTLRYLNMCSWLFHNATSKNKEAFGDRKPIALYDGLNRKQVDSMYVEVLLKSISNKYMVRGDTLSLKLKILDYPSLVTLNKEPNEAENIYNIGNYLTCYDRKYFIPN